MDQQPDKFFREKLYNYQHPLSPEASKRIARKRKGRNSITWLGVAAAVVPIAVAAFLLFRGETEQPKSAIGEKHDLKTNNNISRNDHASSADQTLSNETPKAISSLAPVPEERDIQPSNRDKQKTTPGQTKPSEHQAIANAKDAVAAPRKSDSKGIGEVTGELPPDVISSLPSDHTERKTVTIVFTAEEVNEKYLNKSAVADATPPAKETSRFRKLLDKAYDLKHNQDPLGELRQKKNEIFALNFGNDRQHDEN